MSAAQATLPPPSTALRLLEARVLPEFGAFWLMRPWLSVRRSLRHPPPLIACSPVRGMVWEAPVSNLLPRTTISRSKKR
jgi:hypothetical protein